MREIDEVARLFPDAADYTDVYDRAGGLRHDAILAHAIHLSEREIERLVETGSRDRPLPGGEPVLASGAMPLAATSRPGSSSGWAQTWLRTRSRFSA